MKNITKIALLFVMSLLMATPVFASPKGGDIYAPKHEYVIAEPTGACDYPVLEVGDADLDIISVKSSNNKVAKGVADKENNCSVARVKKAGTAVITTKCKINGKKYTYKTKVHVRKYENPFASFKINGKEYKKAFDKEFYLSKDMKIKNKKIKVSYKLKKGWKIYRTDFWTDKSKKVTFEGEKYLASKKIKSGKTYKAEKWAKGEIELTHGKYGDAWLFYVNEDASRNSSLGYSVVTKAYKD